MCQPKAVEPTKPVVPAGLKNTKWVCEYLGVCARFVSTEVKLKRLRCIRLGKLVRFDPADVMAYAEARKVGGAVPVKNDDPHTPLGADRT
jgi:excisionase family DNA binding protein